MPSPAKVSRQSSRWKLVLCIDDDKNALHPRKLVLEAAGDDMTTATSDRITLRLLKRLITKGHPPAVLLRCLNLLSEGVPTKRPPGKVTHV